MKILVAGGGGFIGSHIVDRLLDDGHAVTIYDVCAPHPDTKKGYKWVDVDITNYERILFNMELGEFDIVYNLASVSNTMECVHDPLKAVNINCLGTSNLLEASVQTNVKKFIMASSSLLSGIMSEDEFVDPTASNHIYVTTKLFQEMLVRDYYCMYKLPYTVLRYGICYGPRMTKGVVADIFIRQALKGGPITLHGDGSQWRQYIYVEDLADANIKVLDLNIACQTFNVVGHHQVSIAKMAHTIQTFFPKVEVNIVGKRSHDLDVTLLSPSGAEVILDWTANTGLHEGLEKTIEYYKERV